MCLFPSELSSGLFKKVLLITPNSMHCGFLIKPRVGKEYETDFPQDKWKICAAPSTFSFFHQTARVVCNNTTNTFKNKQ